MGFNRFDRVDTINSLFSYFNTYLNRYSTKYSKIIYAKTSKINLIILLYMSKLTFRYLALIILLHAFNF